MREDSASVFLALETIRRRWELLAKNLEIGSFPKGLMDSLFMTFCPQIPY